jgi:hypothetical protein
MNYLDKYKNMEVNLFLKNIFNKGFSIERSDTKKTSYLLNKNIFSEVLSIILPNISDSAVNLITKEVIDRGSRTIKADKLILDGLNIWDSLEPVDNTESGIDPINPTSIFRTRGKAFFKGTKGEYYLLTVDEDGVMRWIVDDPNKYLNVFIFELPTLPLPNQNGI